MLSASLKGMLSLRGVEGESNPLALMGKGELGAAGRAAVLALYSYLISKSPLVSVTQMLEGTRTQFSLGLCSPFEHGAHFLVRDHFVCSGEDDLSPALNERVGLRNDFHDLDFELLLSSKEAVPQFVADGAFLKESLERRLVFPDTQDPLHIRHGAAHER